VVVAVEVVIRAESWSWRVVRDVDKEVIRAFYRVSVARSSMWASA
jgi:hypothetical protein